MNMQSSIPELTPELVLIDDDVLTLEIVSWNMRRHECQSHLFSDPEKALYFLRDTVPQLLVVDYYMPTMTGVEFLHKAQQVCGLERTRIFICSAVTQTLPTDLTSVLGVSQIDKKIICNHSLLSELLSDNLE